MQDILSFMQTHWALTLALSFVFIVLIILEFIKQKGATKQLSPAQLTRLMNHENAAIIDVRANDAFASGHIVGAVSLPLADLANKIKKVEKFKSQPIVLVCGSGAESQRAAAIIGAKGLNPYILQGGLRAWKDAEMPIVKG